MPRNALLCEAGKGCPGNLELRFTEPGYCELIARHDDTEAEWVFRCSVATLEDAALGAKVHFASNDGACEIVPMSRRVVVTVTPWGGATAYYLLSREDFCLAVQSMQDAGTVASNFELR